MKSTLLMRSLIFPPQSIILQEWGAALGAEVPYEKAASFLGTILGTPLWGSSIETIMQKSCIDVPKFYEERQEPEMKPEKEILVGTIDGKGVVLRKNQFIKKAPKKRLKKNEKNRGTRKKEYREEK